MEYGNLNYDVPQHRRNLYTRIRKKFRSVAIMQTWSSYLIPWGLAKELSDVIEACNKDSDGLPLPTHDHVRFAVFKYDDKVSGADLERSAKESLQRMVSAAKKTLNEKVNALQSGETEDDDPLGSAAAAAGKAKRVLEDVRNIVLLFNLSDDINLGLIAFAEFIETKRKLIKEARDAKADEVRAAVLKREAEKNANSSGKTPNRVTFGGNKPTTTTQATPPAPKAAPTPEPEEDDEEPDEEAVAVGGEDEDDDD